ncbi:MAG: hypothetical protein CML13_06780 [Puniceicoccaceae bacterium]|nr:hypothetical protein [Puniceicoccaceae bacterium]|tara:strand:+ start:11446 stop:11778 length:333 start_codon:yes stop_codon:yes gene_type:complete
MYSPKIYEPLVPCLYYAGQATNVNMTKLVNAFVYEGLATGYYGLEAANTLPDIDSTLPWLPKPLVQLVEETSSNGSHRVHPLRPTEIQRLYQWYDTIQLVAEKDDEKNGR